MRWLITTKASINLNLLQNQLSAYGCQTLEKPIIPLENNEQVIEIEGPPNLSEQLKTEPEILQVNPSSEMTLY